MNHSSTVPLSVALITLNAERTLQKTLQSVRSWADDIVVVDSGSTDETLNIAATLGCRILYRPFDGYGNQKQFAIDQARHDWVLLLDADEVPDETMQAAICRTIQSNPDPRQAFSLPRSLVFMNHLMRHSGEHRRPVVRLFNRRYGRMSQDEVHERVLPAGPLAILDGTLLHDSYASIHDYLEKMNRYTTAGARVLKPQTPVLHRNGFAEAPSGGLRMLLRFVARFFKIYLLKKGFLDGLPGVVWALLSAMYPVVKYTKQYEQSQQTSPDRPSELVFA